MFVKICGLTRGEDALLAAELGASAVGFVFWPNSPRGIGDASARDIVRQLAGRVTSVGVFVNQPLEDVARVMDFVGLDVAQLHGEESPEYCRQLNRRVIKAIGLENGKGPAVGTFGLDTLILLDAHDLLQRGGTGRTVDWDAAREIAASRKTILAGGLNPENVAQAVAAVRPFGIDVSSGVEITPGVKDPAKLRRFFEALND